MQPERSLWNVQKVGLRQPKPRRNATQTAPEFEDEVLVGGTVDEIGLDELAAGGYSTGDNVLRVTLLGTPYTRGIDRNWQLSMRGSVYTIKGVSVPDQHAVVLEAQRSGR